MSDNIIQLPNGDNVITPLEPYSRSFNLSDLYKYRLVDESEEVINGGGVIVPRVNDLIWSYGMNTWFRVSYRDPTTFVVNLSVAMQGSGGQMVPDIDLYLGNGSGESWRIYIDTRTLPYTLEIDSSFRSYGDKVAKFIVYRGINTSETGEIISLVLNQNGEIVGNEIPAELAAVVRDSIFSPEAEYTNIAIKAPGKAYTLHEPRQGELLTVVGYTQEGVVVREWRFITQIANNYRMPNDSMKRVLNIQLISQYLSSSLPNTLLVPLGTNVDSLAIRARVTYTDGTSVTMDVGLEGSGQKFMLYGLKYWSPSVAGTPAPLKLMYRLSTTEEYSRMGEISVNGYVKEPYQIIATEINPATALKLFGFPNWSNVINSYVMEYWLYDLLRQTVFRVPANAIEYVEGSQAFDGMDYLAVQNLGLSVKMDVLDPSWGTYRHIQRMQVALLREGLNPATNWRVKSSSNQVAWYGDDKRAWLTQVGASITADITCGYETMQDWIEGIYYAQEPLYNPNAEANAPEPTHFILTGRQISLTFPITAWNIPLSIPNEFTEGQTMYLQFIRRTGAGDLQLAVAGLPCHRRS